MRSQLVLVGSDSVSQSALAFPFPLSPSIHETSPGLGFSESQGSQTRKTASRSGHQLIVIALPRHSVKEASHLILLLSQGLTQPGRSIKTEGPRKPHREAGVAAACSHTSAPLIHSPFSYSAIHSRSSSTFPERRHCTRHRGCSIWSSRGDRKLTPAQSLAHGK